jgi:hypothetical protein
MMLLKVRSSPLLSFALCSLVWTSSTVVADNYCQPVTWLAGTGKRGIHLASMVASTSSLPTCSAVPSRPAIQPGEINCRYKYTTSDAVNHHTCTELADKFGTSRERFFVLNAVLKPDCSNIQPLTEYCVIGCKFSTWATSPQMRSHACR